MRKLLSFAALAAILVLPEVSSAQKIVSVDSVTIFEIRKNQQDAGKGILYSRGYVASIIPVDGKYQINVFKQYNGYLSLSKEAPVSKDFTSLVAGLPGMAQYLYGDGGIQLQKEKVFDLTGAGKVPFNYNFYEISGLTGGGTVSTEGKRVISNQELGGDYGMLLRMQPSALSYSGSRKTFKLLGRAGNQVAEQIKQQAIFDLYTGMYWDDPNTDTQRQRLTMKVDAKVPVSFQIDPNHIFYLKPVQKGLLSLMKVDTTLKEVESGRVQLAENFGILNYTVVKGTPDKKLFTLTELENCNTGMAILMGDGFIDRKNGKSYSLIRFDINGKIEYKHDFTIESEGYMFDRATILANTDENILKIVLRKGLKLQMYYLRITSTGVTYKLEWERAQERGAKQITSIRSGVAGRGQDSYVIALPDGESLIGGADFGVGAPGGVQSGYGYTHLGADGMTKAFYSTDCFIPPAIMGKKYTLGAIHIGDGKVMVVADEPRGNKHATMDQYTILNGELSKEYTLISSKNEEGDMVIHLGPNPTAPKAEKSGSKILGGLKMATGIEVFSGQNNDIKRLQIDNSVLLFAPAIYVIDTRNQSIKKIDLNLKGGYTISDKEGIWINTEKRELDAFLKGREKSLEKPGTNPKGVQLQVVKVAY